MKIYHSTLIIVIVALGGCSGFGNPDYGCKGLPVGTKCMATRDIYEATGGGQGIQPTETVNKEKNNRDPVKVHGVTNDQAYFGEQIRITDPVIDNFVTPNIPDRPVPVRTPAQVMRIWVGSWEDVGSGALISPGYIYTEIEPRRWVIGKPESAARAQTKVFKPLDISGEQPK